MAALDVLVDEDLAARAQKLGEIFRTEIAALNSPLVKEVRGRGLLNAVVFEEGKSRKGRTAWQFCLLMKSKGVLAKPTHVRSHSLTQRETTRLMSDPLFVLDPLPFRSTSSDSRLRSSSPRPTSERRSRSSRSPSRRSTRFAPLPPAPLL